MILQIVIILLRKRFLSTSIFTGDLSNYVVTPYLKVCLLSYELYYVEIVTV